jgi:hypothetical protein
MAIFSMVVNVIKLSYVDNKSENYANDKNDLEGNNRNTFSYFGAHRYHYLP